MSASAWAEIDKLRKRVAQLQKTLSQQDAILALNSGLKLGEIRSKSSTLNQFGIVERNVNTENLNAIIASTIGSDLGPISGPVVTSIDNLGNKFILPSANRIIPVQDNGDGTGKQVEINEAGGVMDPAAGSVTLPLVPAEPNSSFHASGFVSKAGRIYPALSLTDFADVSYYLIFVQGFGDGITSTISTPFGNLAVEHDTAGHIINIEVVGNDFFRWDIAAETWTALASTPVSREQHSMVVINGKIYVRGGLNLAGTILNDIWEWDPGTGIWTSLTPPSFVGYVPTFGHMEEPFQSGTKSLYCGGAILAPFPLFGSKQSVEFTPPNTYVVTTNLMPRSVARRALYHVTGLASPPPAEEFLVPELAPPDLIGLYDPPTKLWGHTGQANFGLPLTDYGAYAYQDPIIWRITGVDTGTVLETNTVRAYTVATFSTIVKPNAPLAMQRSASAHDGTNILVFGGQTLGIANARTFLVTDPGGVWTEKFPINFPSARHGHKMVKLGGFVYLFGGLP